MLWWYRAMLGEPQSQFSLTGAALSTFGAQKQLPISFQAMVPVEQSHRAMALRAGCQTVGAEVTFPEPTTYQPGHISAPSLNAFFQSHRSDFGFIGNDAFSAK
jgi:hypothetical protein